MALYTNIECLGIHGQIPFWRLPRRAICGMMSDRSTPYSSIESAIEIVVFSVTKNLIRALLNRHYYKFIISRVDPCNFYLEKTTIKNIVVL